MKQAVLTLIGALGVVFGDIGTSPLYAMKTILGESGKVDTEAVYGMTSAVIWSLVVVVTVLYVGLLLRVDNDGEGGLLALLGLLRRSAARGRVLAVCTGLAIVGAAMFLGDSVITPAISVLSASEGLEQATPGVEPAVVPIALAILVGVFVLQRVGSGRIGALYGPVMALWFATLAAGGAVSLARHPAALQAASPHWAALFFVHHPLTGFLALGAVILTVTGAEALYADLGHFGRPAIARAWLLVVLPALVVAYLGEAAAVVRDPSQASNPFYAVVPGWATIPVVVLATLATVIASEAVIAGGFTVLHQAGGLGLFPYLRTRHPSAEVGRRVYLPAANWALAAAVLLVVVTFQSSEKLASAYGIAVSATILTTVSLYVALDAQTERSWPRRIVAVGCLLVVLAFFAASVPKIVEGGWAPVGIGVALIAVMWSWRNGQQRLARARAEAEESPRELLSGLRGRDGLHRTPQTAVLLTDDRDVTPVALRTMVDGAGILPERVVLLSWEVEDTPSARPHGARVEVDTFDGEYDGVVGVSVRLGFQERLAAQHVLEEACEHAPDRLPGVDPGTATYLVSESKPQLARDRRMPRWRQRIFLLIDRLSTDRIEQLELPRDRTIVIGREFDL